MKNSIVLSVLITVSTCVACGRPFVPVTPSGFVELNDQDEKNYDYRAAHPDGIVSSVRVIPNDPKGDLAFWTRAIENQLRQVKGYRLIEQTTITTRQGVTGNLLKFGHDEGKQPHLYRIALFLHDDDLFLLEQGGTKSLITAHEAELTQVLQGFWFK